MKSATATSGVRRSHHWRHVLEMGDCHILWIRWTCYQGFIKSNAITLNKFWRVRKVTKLELEIWKSSHSTHPQRGKGPAEQRTLQSRWTSSCGRREKFWRDSLFIALELFHLDQLFKYLNTKTFQWRKYWDCTVPGTGPPEARYSCFTCYRKRRFSKRYFFKNNSTFEKISERLFRMKEWLSERNQYLIKVSSPGLMTDVFLNVGKSIFDKSLFTWYSDWCLTKPVWKNRVC